MKRKISNDEERAFRLCHHDYGGKSVEYAAVMMDISVKEIKQLLCCIKHKAPQLFPILTPQHRAILTMYNQGISRATVAEDLNITLPVLKRRVRFLRTHGYLRDRKVVRYQPHMDSQVVQKF
ncbi:hypothetical protein LCGC14_1416840 [marine sediment metagenome]|uniref:Uncharacterized protein n=1 Tax=marine sediment metagenome TaxID=412755 RepID=A0A0F8Z9F3_9ZZZZ